MPWAVATRSAEEGGTVGDGDDLNPGASPQAWQVPGEGVGPGTDQTDPEGGHAPPAVGGWGRTRSIRSWPWPGARWKGTLLVWPAPCWLKRRT